MKRWRSSGLWGIAGACLALFEIGCSISSGESQSEPSVTEQAVNHATIDARRSLAVTEQTILSRFSLQRVLTQLVQQSGVPGLTATALFQQWWDTQNPKPGLFAGPHCDDTISDGVGSSLNGYPYLCRAEAEGAQASCDPFSSDSPCAYIPVGLFNRFDQAPEDGSHCGEYRIVFAKQSGISSTNDRNLLIFEATLPNPHPQQGLKGCQQIVQTWADLTQQDDIQARASALESFYFYGQGLVPPVVSIANYGDNALNAGQIRTNQFSNTTTGWSLREFKLYRTCANGTCSALLFTPVTNKNNAFGPLFDPGSTSVAGAAFRAFFPSQTQNLNASSVPAIDIDTPDTFNSGQSQASGTTAAEMRYVTWFGTAPSSLRYDIQTQLTSLASSLTPNDVVARAQALSCAGCHHLSNGAALGGGLTWPSSLGFTHVTEKQTEVVAGETRFMLSDALVSQFLPARKQILEDYLNDRPHPAKGPSHPLNAWHTHG
jgi:hypothetical protein